MSHVTETIMEYPRITLCSPAYFTKERYNLKVNFKVLMSQRGGNILLNSKNK